MKKHYSGIDGLRTIGCLGIIAMHIQANTSYEINGYFYNTIVPSFTQYVYLFMIISAFGICCGYYQTVKNGNFDVNAFYKRRYGKLWLFFILAILIEILVDHTRSSIAEGVI